MSRRLGFLSIAFGVCAIFVVAPPSHVFAAALSFSPSENTVAAGSVFKVDVEVSSPDQAMNAVSGDISFPSDELRVLSISKLDSIVSLWIQNPSFSNGTPGDVNFEGVVLNPGFMGSAAPVLRITFQVVGNPGDSAQLVFSSGSVLANDGNGTDILDSEGNAQFTIVPAAPVTVSSATPPAAVPAVQASTTTSPPVEPHIVTIIEEQPAGNTQLFLAWALIVLLVLAWLVGIIAVAIYVARRPRQSKAGAKKELIDDLKRIENELEADRIKSEIDLSVAGMRKKEERVRREIEHLERDLRKDLEDKN